MFQVCRPFNVVLDSRIYNVDPKNRSFDGDLFDEIQSDQITVAGRNLHGRVLGRRMDLK